MNKTVVLSILGKDRPGIIAALSRILFEKGCNIEDSSMTILENEFAMILIVAVSEKVTVNELSSAFSILERDIGLSVFIKELNSEETQRTESKKNLPVSIAVYGSDKPGIVFRVTKLLADKKINITDLNTQIAENPQGSVYVMILEASLPVEVSFELLQDEFHSLARDLSVDITLNKIEEVIL